MGSGVLLFQQLYLSNECIVDVVRAISWGQAMLRITLRTPVDHPINAAQFRDRANPLGKA
jgi:hypothetical protein